MCSTYMQTCNPSSERRLVPSSSSFDTLHILSSYFPFPHFTPIVRSTPFTSQHKQESPSPPSLMPTLFVPSLHNSFPDPGTLCFQQSYFSTHPHNNNHSKNGDKISFLHPPTARHQPGHPAPNWKTPPPPPFICGLVSHRKKHLFSATYSSAPTPMTTQPTPAAPTPRSAGTPYNMSSRLARYMTPYDHTSLATAQLSFRNRNRWPETLPIPP